MFALAQIRTMRCKTVVHWPKIPTFTHVPSQAFATKGPTHVRAIDLLRQCRDAGFAAVEELKGELHQLRTRQKKYETRVVQSPSTAGAASATGSASASEWSESSPAAKESDQSAESSSGPTFWFPLGIPLIAAAATVTVTKHVTASGSAAAVQPPGSHCHWQC
jgi:hypothetical protein